MLTISLIGNCIEVFFFLSSHTDTNINNGSLRLMRISSSNLELGNHLMFSGLHCGSSTSSFTDKLLMCETRFARYLGCRTSGHQMDQSSTAF